MVSLGKTHHIRRWGHDGTAGSLANNRTCQLSIETDRTGLYLKAQKAWWRPIVQSIHRQIGSRFVKCDPFNHSATYSPVSLMSLLWSYYNNGCNYRQRPIKCLRALRPIQVLHYACARSKLVICWIIVAININPHMSQFNSRITKSFCSARYVLVCTWIGTWRTATLILQQAQCRHSLDQHYLVYEFVCFRVGGVFFVFFCFFLYHFCCTLDSNFYEWTAIGHAQWHTETSIAEAACGTDQQAITCRITRHTTNIL